jgi:hypothetical protein
MSQFDRSHILDSSGNPRVFYHGSNSSDISDFKCNSEGLIFFAQDPGYIAFTRPKATTYYPVFLTINDLFEFYNPEHINRIKDLVSPHALENIEYGDWSFIESNSDLIRQAGFDAVLLNEGAGETNYDNVAVFNGSQIRSAFDPQYSFGNGNKRDKLRP